MRITQGFVVASLFGEDKAEVGDGETEYVSILLVAIIGGGAVVVKQVERSGDFAAAVDAHASGVDAYGGHVATYCPHGVAHAQGLGGALVVGLREKVRIVDALRKHGHRDEEHKGYGKDFLHREKDKNKDYLAIGRQR